ncbi:hypothetical protein AH03_22965 [Salmonella enterica subsp. enterica serovar Newport]|uniref:hypothetical protein n=1 Tax=Salmonella enterica TaxID=28901 RepID=UPI00061DCDE0|nr:hypothetical protein [Salmonella enterica]AUD56160.2 hypothetical protein AW90_49305 [Salmonella enterica subsp. enterica serovar Newport str. CDC 2010K-2159]EEK1866503.1 hypothetical protein [Salmonella enterica subsp. enterica serovar Newport]
MKIKGALIFLAIMFSLTGCSISDVAQLSGEKPLDLQNELLGDKTFQTASGETLSVNMLKQRYFDETGEKMPEVETTLGCNTDAKCYYDAWSKSYDDLIGAYRRKQQQKLEAEAARKRCEADPECARKSAINVVTQNLNSAYSALVYQNPYLQAQYDELVRQVCTSAGELQRAGMTERELDERVRTAPGIAPLDRGYIRKVASSCWELSRYGVKNGSAQINTPF